VLLSQWDFIDTEREQLAPAESASDEYRHDGVIHLAAERVTIRIRQEPLTLFCGEPIADSNSDSAHSFDPSNPGRKFRTQQSGIGGLVRDPPDGGDAQVDCCRCILLLFEKDSVSQDNGSIECEAWL
jgi:hypothetical protein